MYAVLHPPNFSAQVAARERPELRKLPFALLDGEHPEEIVFAANKAARSLGVETGMTRLQAESFPRVISLRRTLEHENTALVIPIVYDSFSRIYPENRRGVGYCTI